MKQMIIILSIILTIITVGVADADQSIQERIIAVNGHGTASTSPDIAVIQTGVVIHRTNAADALSANNEVMRKIIEVLEKFKVAPKDIQTSGINVRPDYRRDERGGRQTEIVGYQVINQVSVKVRNLDNLGKILDALVRSGSNQISGVNFGIDNPESVLNIARRIAIKDAQNRAELYAEAAGVSVGKVLSISEGSAGFPQPARFGRSLVMESDSSMPVSTGELEFQVNVQMSFGIMDKN